MTSKKAYPLRLDPALFAAIERAAAADLRSVNAQIECLLREALAKRGVRVELGEPAKRGRPPRDQSSPGGGGGSPKD
ncbi:toxin-antitoxin system HicB family antitoxin [Sphingomonas crocodyli]|uniref:Toxin-antitoxin system HicB family antitoxin n=1 Tax=Sphingomonas crocodyli TaxID=1979270 RepID=A0A437M431_9SPHN|nr:toxin-antitoxin system HicB family antitoxin [Sphingomonas crocodyli]RVT92412.1 toxin-antitoxin system HicB family antitoxin [Sphingomonas crocodyli]